MDINITITELLSLLDQKRKLFDSIMKITADQKKDIEENEAGNIEKLVENKQGIIDKIDKIDKAFSEKLDILKKVMNIDSLEKANFDNYPLLKELKLRVEGIMSLAQEIMVIEESNKDKLGLIMNGLIKEMKQLSVGRKSIKAYETTGINSDGIFIDKKK